MFAEEWLVFPSRYMGHMSLSVSAVLTGLALSLPLGILASRRQHVAGPVLGVASIIQTIPGLALLALMVPLLGGRTGFWPVYIALALYSVLPILRNTIVGLQGVDRDVREAALGVGMTPGQRLVQVELPLAAPVMVAGLRTASVWVVGAATLSTPVGAESFGNYIFQGLQTRNWAAVLFGCLASAGLAIALDQIIRLFETAARDGSRLRAGLGAVGLALLALPLLTTFTTSRGSTDTVVVATEPAVPLEGRRVIVGAKTFTEQFILAGLIEARLEADGALVTLREGLGSTVAFDALKSGEIDVYVDYTGTIWATVMKREAPVPRARMYAEVTAELWNAHGVMALGRLGFENAYAFAVTPETAAEFGLETIADLAGSGLELASDPEFFGRPEWTRTRDAYGLQDLKTTGMDSTFMYEAVRAGEVDVITAYTTDGRIDAYDLVLLEDPLGRLPPYDAFILLSPQAAEDGALQDALAPLLMAIDDETMRAANGRVDLARETVGQAVDWLASRIDQQTR